MLGCIYLSTVKRVLKIALLSALSCLYLWLVLISFCFSLAAFWFLTAGLIGLMILKQRLTGSLLICVAVFFLLTPLSIIQYNQEGARMQQKITAGDGLSLKEKLGAYNLNLLLCAGALLVYPDVAREVFLIHIPVKGNVRISNNDFFMDSEVIRKHIREDRMGTVSWGNSFKYGTQEELKYGTALNPCKLSKTDSGYSVEVEVSYPARARTTLDLFGPRLPIYVEEGLMNYLQKEGWLFPYRQVYKSKG